jgi:hypothetical protein
MNERTNEQTNEQANKGTEERMNERISEFHLIMGIKSVRHQKAFSQYKQ